MQRRYERLVMSQVSPVNAAAAGVRALPGLGESFAATQAAWRFYGNPRVSLPQLAAPLVALARQRIAITCENFVLVALDWSGLHFGHHSNKKDRVELFRRDDLGYELLTALAISDTSGLPLAPVALDLRAAEGLYSTRSSQLLPVPSQLDVLAPVMEHVGGQNLGRQPVFLIDREGDSVGHYRRWDKEGWLFLVRAKVAPRVLWEGRQLPLAQVSDELVQRGRLQHAREVLWKGQAARQYVGQTLVTVRRPARTFRFTGKGARRRQRHRNIAGPPLTLRLVVSHVRDLRGRVLARWLLLTNLTELQASASTVALWYYWRWQIESYHKLMKSAGLHLEHWQQESAPALVRRLCVAAMAVALVWQLAKASGPAAGELREVLVGLSGRQMKRGPTHQFTIPALLAGLGVLLPMLCLLEHYPLEQLRKLARQSLPFQFPHRKPPSAAP